ncbi:MAG TPA: type III pantothenate kinase [Chitinivibrionales bacterium]|jgi:type III pantothenate kinase|nr:type III pantothenate kinase [Chitinivibrionales bacterium]
MAQTFVLAIDIGNTNTHAGVIDCDALSCLRSDVFPTKDAVRRLGGSLKKLVSPAGFAKAPPAVVCSVVKIDRGSVAAAIAEAGCGPPVWFEYTPRFPIKVSYDNAALLGPDRLADCLYCCAAHPGKSQIIIDAGTAITVDFLRNGSEFSGGTIMPGISTQLSSLHEHAAALPSVELDESATEFPGRSTKSAMTTGVVYGTAGALSFVVARYREQFGKDAMVMATGGAWRHVEKLVTFEYEFVKEMTMIGTGLFSIVEELKR